MATGKVTVNSSCTKLWENPNPAVGFNPQTIPLDLSGYDAVKIVICPWGNDDDWFVTEAVVGENVCCTMIKILEDYGNGTASQTVINGVSRRANVRTTGIQFFNGQMIYAGSYYKDWNNRAIPAVIYGIKY